MYLIEYQKNTFIKALKIEQVFIDDALKGVF